MKWIVFFPLLFPALLSAQADTSDERFVIIDKIMLEGNKQTKAATILRELDFMPGDSLPKENLLAILERSRLRLLNLGVFTDATITAIYPHQDQHATLLIHLAEGWYVFPVPILSLSDRNFNVWWNEFDHSFKRLNYGIDWSQLNLTGRADILKAKAQFGYTNLYQLAYRTPALNHSRTLGLETSLSYSRAHELSYQTTGNKLQFLQVRESWQVQQILASATLISRPKIFLTQSFTLEYRDNHVSDTIAHMLNPDYYLNGRTRQHHFSAVYSFSYDHRDISPYPLHGWRANFEVRQNGLLPTDNLFLFRAYAEWAQYFSPYKWLSIELVGKLRTSLPRRQPPWSNNQALGYGGNFVRGFEYYVVDGLDFGILRTSCHLKLLERKFNLGRFMPIKAYRSMPLKIYFAINNDFGWANDPYYAATNPLANRLLYGYGPGLDFVLYYDKTIRCEWSRNDLGEQGFFLRINTGF